MHDDEDEDVLADLLHHAREALALVQGVNAGRLAKDRMRMLALERLIEILGEAAGRLSGRTRAALPYDWAGLRAMRNVLAHQYGHVDASLLHAAAKRHLPPLVDLLENR